MSITEIKDTVKTLPSSERGDLLSYLLHLEQVEDSDSFLDRITARIDSPEQFQKWSDIRELPEHES